MHRLPRRLSDFGKLSAGERRVVAGLETGHVTELGPGVPRPDAGEDRRVRASLVRWLALGAPGDPSIRLHEHGLQIMGALIVSDGMANPALGAESTPGLDLQGCTLPHDLLFRFCRFEDAPVLRSARVQTLNLQGSHLPGLTADGLEARDDLFLREVEATGEVRLLGARISGDLDCDGGQFGNPFDKKTEEKNPGRTGRALSADRLEAGGSMFLRQVEATGLVRLLGARIGGNLECDGGRFETPFDKKTEVKNPGSTGTALHADGLIVRRGVFFRRVEAAGMVRLLGARIGGNLDCTGGRFENEDRDALNAQGARVTGTFYWRPDEDDRKALAKGALDLSAAEIGHICDHPACWPARGDLILHRCRYGVSVRADRPFAVASLLGL